MKIGYARVSTKDQQESLSAQEKTLREAGCEEVYKEVASGVKTGRPELLAALRSSREGDTLVVTRLDRLGRSTLETLRTVQEIDARGVQVKALDLDLDTRTPSGRMVLSVISSLAQWERDTLVERTKEGLAHARKNGRIGGRPAALSKTQREAAVATLEKGMSITQTAKTFGVSASTISRLKRSMRAD